MTSQEDENNNNRSKKGGKLIKCQGATCKLLTKRMQRRI